MTTRNKRKLAALNMENCEEHPRSNSAQNSSAPRSQEDYITQISEEIEGRVTKRLSKEFSRTEDRILGALARLDDFFMNPLLPGHSGVTPEPSRNALNTSQGTNEDDSQNDPRPEAGLFHGQITQNSGPEDGHYNISLIAAIGVTNNNQCDVFLKISVEGNSIKIPWKYSVCVVKICVIKRSFSLYRTGGTSQSNVFNQFMLTNDVVLSDSYWSIKSEYQNRKWIASLFCKHCIDPFWSIIY